MHQPPCAEYAAPRRRRGRRSTIAALPRAGGSSSWVPLKLPACLSIPPAADCSTVPAAPMRQLLLVLLLLSVAGQCESQLAPGPWADPSLPPAQRAELLLANLTLAEKVGLLHGTNGRTFGFSAGVQRLGVPGVSSIAWTGPGSGPTMTAWPTGLAIAATFDDSAAAAWGKGKGEEAFEKGGNVDIEIPLCLTRTPNNGRAWEYLSGEDPFLGAKVAAAAVRAVQAEGIVANVKHFADNSQEDNREGVSADIDERTQWEMFYPPFQSAVEAGAGSVMCSLNRINGRWACENEQALNVDLKGRMNFSGWVMYVSRTLVEFEMQVCF
jgi:beta-glucosidase